MKEQYVLADFTDPMQLGRLADKDLAHTTFYANSVRTLLYFEVGPRRYVSAERWGLTVDELNELMEMYGPEYSYTSPASFAWSLWRMHYAPPGYDLPDDGFRATFCRDSLYGGRCEVYRYGEAFLYKYDINSSYPYAATQLTYPDPRSLYFFGSSPHATRRSSLDYIWSHEGASEVTFSQTGPFPILPIRAAMRTIYVEGQHLTGTYTHTELRYAAEHGVELHSVGRQYLAKSCMDNNPFTDFAVYCYQQRQDPFPNAERNIWKGVAVALFGRLAVTGGGLVAFRPYQGDLLRYRQAALANRAYFGCNCLAAPLTFYPRANPLWAAMVLAHARTRLHSMITEECAYVDTDCGMYLSPQTYPISNALGGLKYEEGVYKIAGTKAYGKYVNRTLTDLKLRGKSKAHRGEGDLFAARKTQERRINPDGTTMPHRIDNVQSTRYNEVSA